jgi:CBS-domain-containing membrane protein
VPRVRKTEQPSGRLARVLADYTARNEPRVSVRHNIKAGIGTFVALLALGTLLERAGLPLLITSFGASTLLLFGRPSSPLAQPANLFGGYAIGATTAFLSALLFPGVLWATAISLGLSLMLMTYFRVTHPPAGAIPLIAFADPVHVVTLVEALLVGSVALLLLALVYHRIPPRQTYPAGPAARLGGPPRRRRRIDSPAAPR